VNHSEAQAALHDADGWYKASASGGQGECVEVNIMVPGWVGVRDSKLGPNSPILAFTHSQWRMMITATRASEVDAEDA
jgi:Domain of unknown function (DUF397)